MKILFIHPNFPGQFKHLINLFAKDKKNEVVFATTHYNKTAPENVKVVLSRPKNIPEKSNSHQYLKSFEKSAYAAQSMWRVCNKLKESGFTPDVIYAHPGWGDGLLLKDIFPETPLIAYMEFYYKAFGADVHFHPDSVVNPERVARIRFKNATNLLNLDACDFAISPTHWQANLHPNEFHHKFSVVHEGIDTDLLKPAKEKKPVELPDGSMLPVDMEVVTYVARNFEPYRGFEQAMKSIEILMKQRPKAHFLMIGADGVSYGAKLADGKTYKEKMLKELKLDSSRIHWYGKVSFEKYTQLLSHSMAHIYLTVPFVLSWSVLEAMSIGCPVVASNTSPLLEVIKDKEYGLLAEFFEPSDIAAKVSMLLDDVALRKKISKNARKTIIQNYSIKKILPLYKKLITSIANGKIDKAIKIRLEPKSI
jgi:glycosyltransferase involved in cell wall biosynthesis